MAKGFVFLHLFKSYVSRWRFKVEMSAKQRNTVHSDKNSILWTLGFQIHSYVHCLLRLNRTSQSTPCIPVTKKGNVRCALTPVQTHRRSLATHRNSSPRTPIWRAFLSYSQNHGSLQGLGGKYKNNKVLMVKMETDFSCQFSPTSHSLGMNVMWRLRLVKWRKDLWPDVSGKTTIIAQRLLIIIRDVSPPQAPTLPVWMQEISSNMYWSKKKGGVEFYYRSTSTSTAPSGCVGVKTSLRLSDLLQLWGRCYSC